MTLSALLATARVIAADEYVQRLAYIPKFAHDVISLLSEAAPCGWASAAVHNTPEIPSAYVIEIPPDWVGSCDPEDARSVARMLLSAADLAEHCMADAMAAAKTPATATRGDEE